MCNSIFCVTVGADIIMQLDDVVHVKTTGPRVEEAMWRSVRWLDRCITAHRRAETQNLFGIVQGGLQPELRKKCVEGEEEWEGGREGEEGGRNEREMVEEKSWRDEYR